MCLQFRLIRLHSTGSLPRTNSGADAASTRRCLFRRPHVLIEEEFVLNEEEYVLFPSPSVSAADLKKSVALKIGTNQCH